MLNISESKKSVLIATRIDYSKDYLFDLYSKGVLLQGCDVLICDTTANCLFKKKSIENGFKYETFFEKKLMDIVVGARQKCIDYAKDNNYKYIFFIDSDILLDSDILSKLLYADKNIISAVYFSNSSHNKKEKFIVHNLEAEKGYRRMKKKELYSGLIPACQIAFGCVLIKIEVFENIRIRCERDEKGVLIRGEDYCFSTDAYIDNNMFLWIDSDIIVTHNPTHEWLLGDI